MFIVEKTTKSCNDERKSTPKYHTYNKLVWQQRKEITTKFVAPKKNNINDEIQGVFGDVREHEFNLNVTVGTMEEKGGRIREITKIPLNDGYRVKGGSGKTGSKSNWISESKKWLTRGGRVRYGEWSGNDPRKRWS